MKTMTNMKFPDRIQFLPVHLPGARAVRPSSLTERAFIYGVLVGSAGSVLVAWLITKLSAL